VLAALAGTIVLAWVYLLRGAGLGMHAINPGGDLMMPMIRVWTPGYSVRVLAMWGAMMMAMTLPGAVPALLRVVSLPGRRDDPVSGAPAALIFAAGSLAVWTGFSALAAVAQWILHAQALLSPRMVGTSPLLGGAILIAAGIFQWTPLKHACLAHCRSPLGFFMTQWRDGMTGAFTMGIKHGLHCLGCCWMLMGLLFVFGAMNLIWVAALSFLVILEKLMPFGHAIARVSGVAMIAGAIVLAFHR